MVKEDITDKTAKEGLEYSKPENHGLEQVTEFSIHSSIWSPDTPLFKQGPGVHSKRVGCDLPCFEGKTRLQSAKLSITRASKNEVFNLSRGTEIFQLPVKFQFIAWIFIRNSN